MNSRLNPEAYCAANEHPLWNQSHYFTFYDPDSRIGCFIRAGIMENKQESNSWLVFFKDGLPLYTRINMNLPYTSARMENGIEIAGMKILGVDAQKRASISFQDRDFSFDLTFTAIHPMHDSIAMTRDNDGAFAENIATAHLEGPCSVSGELRLRDGLDVSISNGRGFRDLAVGPRDWDGLKHYRLAWPLFDNNVSAVCVHGISLKGENAYMKMVNNGKEWRQVTSVDEKITYSESLFIERVRWDIEDEDGKKYGFSGRSLFSWHFPVDTFICTESMMEYRLDDGTIGYGLGECGFRLPWDFQIPSAG
ncbi:MAG: hypothetical protein R3E73_10580 [Porticoccaceae bacterium]|nr:hypothetical protein [Pseudomonadales bacterium]MCP5171092.1 hypothetical protein [Pseudomonadales bacterium]MCP5301669.1 hypothetical protein [Pseudomonadales bacterium]